LPPAIVIPFCIHLALVEIEGPSSDTATKQNLGYSKF